VEVLQNLNNHEVPDILARESYKNFQYREDIVNDPLGFAAAAISGPRQRAP
jgi:hypothetical protein